ncbi:MAG: hypothetical protein KAS32_28155 [Candidatus Peribacteraceae bacterium]|nr:hypothetical protein [Candidatus Peribacteraceae bacterium]
MKVEITTVIEIPDDELVEGHEFASAVQIVADEITRYVPSKHLEDAIDWEIKSKDDLSGRNRMMSMHHVRWGKFLSKLKWNYKEVKE